MQEHFQQQEPSFSYFSVCTCSSVSVLPTRDEKGGEEETKEKGVERQDFNKMKYTYL